MADLKKITITSKMQDATIIGNKYSLVDCLVILLDNAVKYSKEAAKVSVTLGERRTQRFSVTDHGMRYCRK